MNYKQCAKALLGKSRILILTHKNPDGDTVGSASALCSALRRCGKDVCLYPNPQIGGKLKRFSERYFAPEGFEPELVVAVDVATEGLFPKGFEGKADLCIDHHPTNSLYAGETLLRDEKSSTGEIIMEIIKTIATEPTEEEATMLYVALTTDTGCFQYANVNAASFRAAAELVRMGADNVSVSRDYFRKVSRARLKLESLIYAGLEYYREGKIVVATVTREMMARSGACEEDCDDLAGLSGRAEGCMLNITIRENEDESCKISLRSTDEVSSSDICAVFGGGGHRLAAGCTISGTPDKAKEMLLQVIDEVWK